jgi:hypothetical protein
LVFGFFASGEDLRKTWGQIWFSVFLEDLGSDLVFGFFVEDLGSDLVFGFLRPGGTSRGADLVLILEATPMFRFRFEHVVSTVI